MAERWQREGFPWLANNQNSEEKFNGICAYGPKRFMLTAHLNTH